MYETTDDIIDRNQSSFIGHKTLMIIPCKFKVVNTQDGAKAYNNKNKLMEANDIVDFMGATTSLHYPAAIDSYITCSASKKSLAASFEAQLYRDLSEKSNSEKRMMFPPYKYFWTNPTEHEREVAQIYREITNYARGDDFVPHMSYYSAVRAHQADKDIQESVDWDYITWPHFGHNDILSDPALAKFIFKNANTPDFNFDKPN